MASDHKENDSLDWVPHVSVNGFLFEETFESVNDRAFLEHVNSWEGRPGLTGDTDIYQCGELELAFEDGHLSGIDFEDRCVLDGIDLIGQSVDDTIEALVAHARLFVSDPIKVVQDEEPFPFDDGAELCYGIHWTGVHVWVSVETGLVVNISFFKNDEDD